MTFKKLNISKPIIKALKDKGYEEATPIQQEAIPVIIKGRDLLGIAQTGTGKTAAFAIPIIQRLDLEPTTKSKRVIKTLVLTPTRELAMQVDASFSDYAKYTKVKNSVIFGGVNQVPQIKRVRQGVDILTATPGRLLDLISQKHISLSNVDCFVLDEADRMLDMGFIHDINRIIKLLPKERQTLFFSATMPPEITKLSRAILTDPVRVEVAPQSSVVDTIEQKFYSVEKQDKRKLLTTILKEERDKSVLVFSRTKHGADRISKHLKRDGIGCETIHGNKRQGARQRALRNFKSGKSRVIVATDIAARGIDITELGMVINFDLPDVAETYVHRIGRTGRAGNIGLALTFCSKNEKPMIRSIQKLIGRKIDLDVFVN